MAAPLYQDSGTTANGVATASVVLPKPANLSVGDTMVAYFICTTLTVNVTTPPSGWVAVPGSSGTAGRQSAVTTDNETAFCYTRVADAADVAATNFTWAMSAAITYHSPGIMRVTGSNGTVNASSSLGNTGQANHAIPSITTTVADCLLLAAWGMGTGSQTWTLPGSMTSIYNATLQSLVIAVGREDWLTAGATGTRTATTVGQGSADFMLALEPGVGGGATDPAVNTNFSAVIGDEFALRTDVQETGGVAVTDGFHLYAQKNVSGGYTRVTTSSAGLRILATSRFVDGAATTDLLTGGTGTFVAGEGDEDGATGQIAIGAGGNTEIEWSLTIDATGVTAGDFWDVRVYRDDGSQLDNYAVTARITAASAAASPTISLNPTSLNYNLAEGSGQSNRSVNISNTGGGSLTFSTSDDQTWLSVSPASGTAPTTLTVTVDATTLTQAGSPYSGTVTITDPESTNSPQTVAVSVVVGPPSSFPIEIVSGAAGYESIWLETSNDLPPTIAPNGAMYIINEHSDAATDQGRPGMRKSTDGGATWTHMDPQTTGKFDLESGVLLLVGTDLIFAWQRSGYYGYFNVFDTTTDTWTNRSEAWKAETSITATDQVCTLAERSDGTYVLVVTSSATQLSYLTRSTAPAWSAMTVLDAEAGKDFSQAYIKKSANGDAVHILYYCLTDGILYHRSLSSGGVLSARTSVATGLSTGSGTASFRKSMPNQALLCWDNAGTDRLYVAYRKSDGKLYGRTLDGSGAAPTINAEESISPGFIGINPDGIISYQAVGVLARDAVTGEIYALWADANTATSNFPTPVDAAQNNVKMRVRSTGGTWGSTSSPHIAEPVAAMAASIITYSGTKYVMFFYDEYTGIDPGVSKFNRFAISSVGAMALPNRRAIDPRLRR